MKSTVVDESLSSFKPMYCSREYQASTRLIQQYEKSTLNSHRTCWGGPRYKVPVIDSYEKNHIVHVGARIPLLTVTRFPVHVGDPITRFLSLTVTRFPHSNHIIHVGDPITRFPSLTVTRFPVHVGGPHYMITVIDSYKVPTFNHACGWTPLQGSHH